MAQLGNLGDLSNDKVSNGFEPIPAGTYKAQVIETELGPTKDGTGQTLKAKFVILDGEYANRTILTRYNLVNKNAQAQEIGRGQLKALATYCGHLNPNVIRNTEELHGRPVMITVVIRPAKDGFEASNEIKKYAAVGSFIANKLASGTAAAGFSAPKPQAPAAPAPSAAPAPAPAAAVGSPNAVATADDDIPPFDATPQTPPPAPAHTHANPDALKAAAGF